LARKPRQMSGGQRQRVAMGRAIVRDPQVFLFDEPLSNLDAKLRVQMRVEIKQLQRRLGTTSIYVTHDQVEAMTLADRLIVLNAGVAEQIGAPIELYERPATLFVAGFIGSPAMNFLEATGTGEAEVTLPGGLRVATNGIVPAGAAATLGIRPEHVLISPEAGLSLTIELVELLGADSIVHGRLPGGAALMVPVALPATAQHFFDRASGRRLDLESTR